MKKLSVVVVFVCMGLAAALLVTGQASGVTASGGAHTQAIAQHRSSQGHRWKAYNGPFFNDPHIKADHFKIESKVIDTINHTPRGATIRIAVYSFDRMPVAQAQELNTPPVITDVVPLPADDVNGASLGFLTQALALGGTIASMGLGRLIPRTRSSWKRGLAHVSTLALYAFGSALVVLWSMSWFGVGDAADRGEMLAIFSLISLAITGSTAGAVALLGPAGALVGAMYFTLGTVISGASILPEFLPAFGRHVGENLPTGAGVQAVRDNLYFPDAPIGSHLLVLGLYAGIGCALVLVTNMLPNRKDQTSEVELALVERLEGAERREPVDILK